MLQPEDTDRSKRENPGELYSRDYFFGKSSGYPAEGYSQLRDNWHSWLSLISQIKAPPGTFIDLGSAYGYLVSTARQNGYQAFGCDISSYALQQEPDLKPQLARADVHRLPFPCGEADVVTVFDVLEHLRRPEQCLAEAVRILKPEGLLAGATPDPIFFERTEETHCFERPPSFWHSLLQKLGLAVQFRFSEEPYNFQFIAARSGSSTAKKLSLLQHDYFSHLSDFIAEDSGDLAGSIKVVPRFGWGPLEEGSRQLNKSPAYIYILNPKTRPIRLSAQMTVDHSDDFSTLRIRLDSHLLKDLHLTSEQTSHTVKFDDLIVPAGGHHLFFDLFPGGPEVSISNVRFKVDPGDSAELTSQLPFDLQQRYGLARDIARIIRPEKVLDVGGFLGDQDGHLAVSEDFLKAPDMPMMVVTTDLRHCDHPSHHPCEAARQPFPSDSFDLVLSLDVLEHLPEEDRTLYLEELNRLSSRWILLGAPFFTEQVESLEESLADQLDLAFLKEHRQHGLPAHSLIEDFFVTSRGYSIKAFPNGYLPVWAAMQMLTQHLFTIRDHRVIQEFNRLYSQHIYANDQRVPSYRTVYLVSKGPVSHRQLKELDGIIVQSNASFTDLDRLSLDPDLASINRLIRPALAAQAKALNDVQFLINERQKAIRSLTALNYELQSMPMWKILLKRIRRSLKERHPE